MSYPVQVHIHVCRCAPIILEINNKCRYWLECTCTSLTCILPSSPTPTPLVMSSFSGNHTFAAIRGKESYQLIGALSVVIGEINSLVVSESLAVLPGVKVEVVLGGDYKVSILIECI